jgi:hypothetical protein
MRSSALCHARPRQAPARLVRGKDAVEAGLQAAESRGTAASSCCV